MKIIVGGLLVLGLGILYYIMAPPFNKSFLYGKWTLVHSTTKSAFISYMDFKDDNTVELGNKQMAVYTNCHFEFIDRKNIDLECINRSQKVLFPIKLEQNDTHIVSANGNRFSKSTPSSN